MSMRRLLYSTFVQRKHPEIGNPTPLVPLHRGLDHHAPHYPQSHQEVSLDDLSPSIYTDRTGMQFRIRRSDQKVFTYRPSTKELVLLCSLDDWPKMIIRLGLKVSPETLVKRTGAD